jgi:hypothetical protein
MEKRMESNDTGYTQLTFHYTNGESESFHVYQQPDNPNTQAGMPLEVRHLLKKEWWILNLPEQTVFINVANVTKVEVKPTVLQLKGEDVFPDAERVTALSRAR